LFGCRNEPADSPSDEASMGRGDKRTEKGKRFKGSFGNSRPKTTNPPAKKKTAPAPAKKK
jgi:30S ribosomal protein S31